MDLIDFYNPIIWWVAYAIVMGLVIAFCKGTEYGRDLMRRLEQDLDAGNINHNLDHEPASKTQMKQEETI